MFDYSVTWNEMKDRTERKLIEKGINGDDKIAMCEITYAFEKAWSDFNDEKDREYGLSMDCEPG